MGGPSQRHYSGRSAMCTAVPPTLDVGRVKNSRKRIEARSPGGGPERRQGGRADRDELVHASTLSASNLNPAAFSSRASFTFHPSAG
jgi:hypothetical protein